MSKSKVYFTDFHTRHFGESLPKKLKMLMKKAGIGSIEMEDKFVAIKMHFGELGNLAYLRPNYAKAVADTVNELGGKPFLTDCNTMYVGSRKNGIDHLYCAWENGFTPISAGCPVIIADGIKGTDDVKVPVEGGQFIKSAYIGRAIMDADILISLTHFKGHESTGFGGAIKNIGMGSGSRAGKCAQHSSGKPKIDQELCRGCRMCQRECANSGLDFDEKTKKMHVNYENCVGCGRCLAACNFNAISFSYDSAIHDLNCKMAEYTKAVVEGRPSFHVSLVVDVSPNCDCHSENDIPILPNVGMFCSFDPVALDQACVDACLRQEPIPGSQLYKHMHDPNFDKYKDDPFKNSNPESDWKAQLSHAEKIGLGSRDYELIEV